MENCIFCKIINGKLPSTKRFEDENIIAINDINPVNKTHILFIPKEHIDAFENIKDDSIFPSIRLAAQRLIGEEELIGKGYKILVGGGRSASSKSSAFSSHRSYRIERKIVREFHL